MNHITPSVITALQQQLRAAVADLVGEDLAAWTSFFESGGDPSIPSAALNGESISQVVMHARWAIERQKQTEVVLRVQTQTAILHSMTLWLWLSWQVEEAIGNPAHHWLGALLNTVRQTIQFSGSGGSRDFDASHYLSKFPILPSRRHYTLHLPNRRNTYTPSTDDVKATATIIVSYWLNLPGSYDVSRPQAELAFRLITLYGPAILLLQPVASACQNPRKGVFGNAGHAVPSLSRIRDWCNQNLPSDGSSPKVASIRKLLVDANKLIDVWREPSDRYLPHELENILRSEHWLLHAMGLPPVPSDALTPPSPSGSHTSSPTPDSFEGDRWNDHSVDVDVWSLTAIILVESLSFSVDDECIPELASYLQGGMNISPDHFWPFRALNPMSKLIESYFGPFSDDNNTVASRTGLSELLIWHGFGQGWRTTEGLTVLSPPYHSLDTAISRWLPFSPPTPKSKRRPERVSNTLVWSDQPAGSYGVDRTRAKALPSNGKKREMEVMPIADSLGEYWNDSVHNAWEEWISDENDDRSWTAFGNMIHSLHLRNFSKSSLGRLQLGNTLFLYGLVEEPTFIEMCREIFDLNSGAIKGLRCLGFICETFLDVCAAFSTFHGWLGRLFSEDEKCYIRHSFNMTEHILCKVPRWWKREDVRKWFDVYSLPDAFVMITTEDVRLAYQFASSKLTAGERDKKLKGHK
jgi:hypothetical protein